VQDQDRIDLSKLRAYSQDTILADRSPRRGAHQPDPPTTIGRGMDPDKQQITVHDTSIFNQPRGRVNALSRAEFDDSIDRDGILAEVQRLAPIRVSRNGAAAEKATDGSQPTDLPTLRILSEFRHSSTHTTETSAQQSKGPRLLGLARSLESALGVTNVPGTVRGGTPRA
jgi:hypothetical protein